MTATEVTIQAPQETPNLQQLADSTLNVFQLLRPWYTCQHPSSAVLSVKLQAQSYMSALRLSIGAAHYGHLIAEEVLSFSSNIESASEEERQDYLRGLHQMAVSAQESAEQAQQSFRSVRKRMSQIIEDARAAGKGSSRLLMSTHLSDLQKGIPVLEKFQSCISSYAGWWSNMFTAQKSQTARSQHVLYNYNLLRMRSVVDRWKELQREYAEYIAKVQVIEDADLEFPSERAKISDDGIRQQNCLGPFEERHRPLQMPQDDCQHHTLPTSSDGTALLFAPILILGKRPLRKRDHIRAWGRHVWEEVVG